MTVAILYGGKSGEHEVSLLSALSVVKNIDKNKHSLVLIGITKKGLWYVQDESVIQSVLLDNNSKLTITEKPDNLVSVLPGGGTQKAFFCKGKSLCVDVVLPILHGTYGEDGLLQGLLEMAELPYCGCGVMASSLAMDKEKAKQVWAQEGLPVVPYVCVKSSQKTDSVLEAICSEAANMWGFPLFVKPCCAGSSVGTAKASSEEGLKCAIENAFKWDEKILIEPFIPAREIECSVTGNTAELSKIDAKENKRCVTSYELGEIAPTHEFYDYEAKYTDPDGADLIIPAILTDEQEATIKDIAKKAYKALDCSGLSRVDFFIDKNTGSIYINELNTLPGFTSISMFPKMCEAGGLAYKDVIELILEQGVERFKSRQALTTSL